MTILLSTLILNLQMIFGIGNVTPAQIQNSIQQSGAIVVVDTLTLI